MWLKEKSQQGLSCSNSQHNGRIYGTDFNRKEKYLVSTDGTCENLKYYTSDTPKLIIYVYIKCVYVSAEGRISF